MPAPCRRPSFLLRRLQLGGRLLLLVFVYTSGKVGFRLGVHVLLVCILVCRILWTWFDYNDFVFVASALASLRLLSFT